MMFAEPCRPTCTRRRLLALPLMIGALLGVATGSGAQIEDVVTLQTARELHEAGRAVLIDIREPDEHARGVAAGVKLLPMSQLRQRVSEIPVDPALPVLLICNSQNRSSATLKALRQQGYAHVRYVHGGMAEWVHRGWPVVSPGG
jgi:rhodanese-related sulfurtransferase